MDLGLSGAKAVISGGSQGIGLAVAKELLREGASVSIAARRKEGVDAAVAETRRCATEYGFKAIFLSPGCVNRRPWHHSHYDPLWAECESLGITLGFHGGGQNYLTPDSRSKSSTS